MYDGELNNRSDQLIHSRPTVRRTRQWRPSSRLMTWCVEQPGARLVRSKEATPPAVDATWPPHLLQQPTTISLSHIIIIIIIIIRIIITKLVRIC